MGRRLRPPSEAGSSPRHGKAWGDRLRFASRRRSGAPRRLLAGLLALDFAPQGEARAQSAAPCTVDRATGADIDKTPVIRNGYVTRWNAASDRLAYMGPGEDGIYRVFTARPDGWSARDITENTPGLPKGHQGMASWHPSGRFLVVAVEKPDWKDARMFGNPD